MLKLGIPTIEDVEKLEETDSFEKMKGFSGKFLSTNEKALSRFRKRWVKDPLFQWSRMWEYPFVASAIKDLLPTAHEKLHVIDAGSGATFFPFFLSQQLESLKVTCIDADSSLEKVYNALTFPETNRVQFQCQDMRSLDFTDQSIDGIYSISVLEHTKDYPDIIQEFFRILKPNAPLILTFDISLDGYSDISVEQAKVLVETVQNHFNTPQDFDFLTEIEKIKNSNNILSTSSVRKKHPDRIPWVFPKLSALKSSLKKGRFHFQMLNLTCCCLVGIKK